MHPPALAGGESWPAMVWFVVAGEEQPKVYTDAAQARRACRLATHSVERFETLKAAGQRR